MLNDIAVEADAHLAKAPQDTGPRNGCVSVFESESGPAASECAIEMPGERRRSRLRPGRIPKEGFDSFIVIEQLSNRLRRSPVHHLARTEPAFGKIRLRGQLCWIIGFGVYRLSR
jgi:hypothetical protein